MARTVHKAGEEWNNEFDIGKATRQMHLHQAENHIVPGDGLECAYIPMQEPVSVRLWRKLRAGKGNSKTAIVHEQVGHTMEVCYSTFGVKLYTKWNREHDRLVVFLEDSDGRTIVGEYERS